MAAGALREDDIKRGFSFSNAAAVTAADTDLATPAECIYVGGNAGTLVITTTGGQTVTITVPSGQYVWLRTKRVAAASTATGIIAMW